MELERLKNQIVQAMRTTFLLDTEVSPELKEGMEPERDPAQDSRELEQLLSLKAKKLHPGVYAREDREEGIPWKEIGGVPGLIHQAWQGLELAHEWAVENKAYHWAMVGLVVLIGLNRKGSPSSEVKEGEKVSPVRNWLLDRNIQVRGRSYQVRVAREGVFEVNGRTWKLRGSGIYSLASIKITSVHFDEDAQKLSFGIRGETPIKSQDVQKELDSGQTAFLLETLATADQDPTTPEMKAAGVELVPASIAS